MDTIAHRILKCFLCWVAASLLFVSSTVAGVWDLLSAEEQKMVLEKTRSQLEEQLKKPNSPLIRDDASGDDDVLLKAWAASIITTDTEFLASNAAKLSTGDFDSVTIAVLDRAADLLAQQLLDRALKQLPEDSPTHVYLKYLAGKGDALKTIGRGFFDSKMSWSKLVELSWSELNKAAAEDLKKEIENGVVAVINFAVGEGRVPGITIGEAYVNLVKAEIQFMSAFETGTVKAAANAFYNDYLGYRKNGDGEEEAWKKVSTELIGKGGAGNILKTIQSGSLRNFRQGGYLLRHVTLEELRSRFEQCFRKHLDYCTVEVQTAFDAQQEETRRAVKAEVAKVKAQMIGEESLIRPGEVRSLYSHFVEQVSAVLLENLSARQLESEDSRQKLAQARYASDTLLARLTQVREDVCRRRDIVFGVEPDAREAYRELAALYDRVKVASILTPSVAECGGLTNRNQRILGQARDLLSELKASGRDANLASSAACDWPDPASEQAAQIVLQASLEQGIKTSTAAAKSRQIFQSIKALGDNGPSEGMYDTRQELVSLIPGLEAAPPIHARYRAALLNLRKHQQRAQTQLGVANSWMQDIRNELSPFQGLLEVDERLDRGERLMGNRLYTEEDNTISECETQVFNKMRYLERETALADANADAIAQMLTEARAALFACPLTGNSIAELVTGIVLEARAEIDRLDAFEQAAAVCAARARQLADGFSAGGGDGWGNVRGRRHDDTAGVNKERGNAALRDCDFATARSVISELQRAGDENSLAEARRLHARLRIAEANRAVFEEHVRALANALRSGSAESIAQNLELAMNNASCPSDLMRLREAINRIREANAAELESNRDAMRQGIELGQTKQREKADRWADVAGFLDTLAQEVARSQQGAPISGGAGSRGTSAAGGGADTGGSSSTPSSSGGSSASCVVERDAMSMIETPGNVYFVLTSTMGEFPAYGIRSVSADMARPPGWEGPFSLPEARRLIDNRCPASQRSTGGIRY